MRQKHDQAAGLGWPRDVASATQRSRARPRNATRTGKHLLLLRTVASQVHEHAAGRCATRRGNAKAARLRPPAHAALFMAQRTIAHTQREATTSRTQLDTPPGRKPRKSARSPSAPVASGSGDKATAASRQAPNNISAATHACNHWAHLHFTERRPGAPVSDPCKQHEALKRRARRTRTSTSTKRKPRLTKLLEAGHWPE